MKPALMISVYNPMPSICTKGRSSKIQGRWFVVTTPQFDEDDNRNADEYDVLVVCFTPLPMFPCPGMPDFVIP